MSEVIPQRNRSRASRKRCQICHREYGAVLIRYTRSRVLPAVRLRESLDHIIPRRYLRTKSHKSPHTNINLISTCGPCHGKKAPAERALDRGDWLRFCEILNRIGYPMDSVFASARYYGLLA